MKDVKSLNNNFPWLVFCLNKSFFALNCENITTITIMPKEIIQPVLTPDYVKGLLDLRGDIIPLIDVRSLFDFPSVESEKQEVLGLLNQGMENHKNWVDELNRCVRENEAFKLELDPHKCNFGRWYDSYESKYYIVNSHLKKINQPHCELHAAGAKIVELMKSPPTQDRDDKINEYLHLITNDYMQYILSVVKNIEEDWDDAQKNMVVVFDYNDRKIGLIVDEVKSVENLEIINQEVNIDMQNIAHYFCGIARSIRTNDVVFLIDENQLGELFMQADYNVDAQGDDRLAGVKQ